MRIKAKMLLPRKELDAQGNEIDPRQELVNKILEYKRFKEASAQMAEMEALRMLMVKRGNIQKELSQIGEEAGEGTEIQNITLFKLMRAFERAMQKYSDRINKPVHTVVQYSYTMEAAGRICCHWHRQKKQFLLKKYLKKLRTGYMLYFFFSLLELVQQKFMKIMIGKGRIILSLNTMSRKTGWLNWKKTINHNKF